jgi:hypothetical protein
LVALRVLAHPPRGFPVVVWKTLVAFSCWVRVDDDIIKLAWKKPTIVRVTKGEHAIMFFHQLGTLSARDVSTELVMERDVDLHYYSRFFPFRRGTIVGERHYRDERQPPARY